MRLFFKIHLETDSEAEWAMDVFSSVRAVGYPIGVLTTYEDTMNRYAFLLIR